MTVTLPRDDWPVNESMLHGSGGGGTAIATHAKDGAVSTLAGRCNFEPGTRDGAVPAAEVPRRIAHPSSIPIEELRRQSG